MEKTGKVLIDKIDTILEEWLEKIRQDRKIESTVNLSDTALGDSIPDVLNALTSLLKKNEEEYYEKITEASLEHGTLRARQGYNPEEISREYSLLRAVIFSNLKSEVLTYLPSEIIETYDQVNEVLDIAITQCFNSYVEARLVEAEQIQTQLNLTNEELSQLLENSKRHFSYLAHEIKAPLTAVIGYSELLERFQGGSHEHSFGSRNVNVLERVLQGARHLLRIVNDALQISVFETSQIQLNIEPTNVQQVIQTVIDLMKPLVEQKELELLVDYERAPKAIITDAFRLQQILINLMSNAIRYTDEGRIEIISETESDRFSIIIRDTGIGISSEDSQRIFEPYSQAYTNQGRRQGEGTGLGLAITAKLVNLLQGEIQLTSEPGKGSSFTVNFPLQTTSRQTEGSY